MLVDSRPDSASPETSSSADTATEFDGGDAGPSAGRRARVLVERLTVGYRPDTDVLHDVSIDVSPGETLSLLGPSGCGKTTLLRAIAGLQQPTAGEIRIGDTLVDGPGVHAEPHRRRVGMVFQHGALFPHLTVAENVAFGLRGHTDPQRRTAEMLALVELSELADRLPDSLSGGQRQRVALARALAPNPAVLLLDEPFSALDAGMRNQIRRDVKGILQQIGITTIVVTHDQDEAFVFADRVALMREGVLVQVGPSTELYDRPRNRWVADFVGEVNLVSGRLSAGPSTGTDIGLVNTPFGDHEAVVVDSSGDGGAAGGVADPGQTLVDVLIRPEQLEIAGPGSDRSESERSESERSESERGDSDRSVVGVVQSAEYFGHDVLYQVESGSAILLVRTTDSSYRPGDEVRVGYVGRRVVVWPRPD